MEITNYEKLPETISKHGMNYKLLKRNDKAAIYSQYTKEGLHVGYEVFIVKVQPEFKFPNGVINPAKESFPSSEMFGKTAWAYMAKKESLALAENRYDEITNGILRPVKEEIEPEELDIPKVKRGRGRPKKLRKVNTVVKERKSRGKFVYEGKEYNSKSDVVRILLGNGEEKKSVARKLGITVQTVHAVMLKMRSGK